MRKSELSDKQLEDMLRQMPKIKDHRDPRDIYQNITVKLNKQKRRPVWIAPSIAMAAAIFLFFITANTINWRDLADFGSGGTSESSDKMIMMDADMSEESSKDTSNMKMAESTDEGIEESATGIQSLDVTSSLSAVYEHDLGGQELLTFEVPDPNFSFTVPVSVIAQKKEGSSWLDLYEEVSVKLKEEEWGLINYYPLNADFDRIQGEETIRVDVPADNQYCCGGGSAPEAIFVSALEKMFQLKDIQKVTLYTNGTPGIDFSHYGLLKEIKVKQDKNRAYYFYYPKDLQQPLLVPSENTFDNLETALLQMTKGPEVKTLASSIPDSLTIDFNGIENIDNNTVQIELDNKAELHDGMLTSIEAILFAAKSFGFDYVKFENTTITQLGPFNLNEKIPVPVSPNKKIVE